MAEQIFPQIPSTVWWGVRQMLQRSPKAKLDETMLGANLGVQTPAAKQYLGELRRVGIIDEEGRATDLANQWRMDDTYPDAVEAIARVSYPEGLVTISPPSSPDRQKVVNWFMRQGLGEGSAKNKAATYLLVTNPVPNGAAPPVAQEGKRTSGQRAVERSTKESTTRPKTSEKPKRDSSEDRAAAPGAIPLNLNVQIHISADASSEQIETIFSAMRKYLRND